MTPNIYYSSKTEALTAMLLENIKQEKEKEFNPFQQTYILIPNSGMQRYLEIQIANALGVAAQISIIYPAQFLWQCYQLLLEDVSKLAPIDQRKITFELISLFKQQDIDSPFAKELGHWLKIYSTSEQRFQLASRLAKLFNNYINQRSDWVEKWKNNQTIFNEEEQTKKIEQWQIQLFKALQLTLYAKYNIQKKFHHHLAHHQETSLTESLKTKSIHLFGFNTFPKPRLDDFIALSNCFDVNFYLINPSIHYWQDIVPSYIKEKIELTTEDEQSFIEVGHPLLASWGQAGKSLISDLETFNPINIDDKLSLSIKSLLQWLQQDITYFDKQNNESLLHQDQIKSVIQKDINQQNIDGTDKAISSISIHVTSGPKREVEILYETLCNLLDKDPTLNPNDIIIMLPNLSDYSSHIQSIFPTYGQTNHLPYSIADQSSLEYHSEANLFLKLLSLINSDFKAQDLLDCLNHTITKNHYQLTEDELIIIKRWLIDSHFTKNFYDNSNGQQSSIEKLQNMLVLAATGEKENTIKNNDKYYTSATFYQFNQSEALLKLSQFINDIKAFAHIKLAKYNLVNWHHILFEIAQKFIATEGVISQSISEWSQLFSGTPNTLNKPKEKQLFDIYDFQTILCDWQAHLTQEKLYGPFLSGGISFCTTLPMRIIPSKFIAILGLNQNIPNIEKKHPLDLIQKKPRWSDMLTHKAFKYLFLETLLSARDFFYLSYCGENAQTLEKNPPSILVEELISYLKSHQHDLSINTNQLIHNYPTQSFLTSLNIQSSYLNIYNPSKEKIKNNHQSTTQDNSLKKKNFPENWSTKLIIDFLTIPSSAYFKYTLGLIPFELQRTEQLKEDDILNTRDSELISWQYSNTLLQAQIDNDKLNIEQAKEKTIQLLQQQNIAAPNNLLSTILGKKNEKLKVIIDRFSHLNISLQSITQYIEFNFQSPNTENNFISCLLHTNQYYRNSQYNGLFDYQLSNKAKPKKILSLWVQHLLLTIYNQKHNNKPSDTISYLVTYDYAITYESIGYQKAIQALKIFFELIEILYKNPLFAVLEITTLKKQPHFILKYVPVENIHYPNLSNESITETNNTIQAMVSALNSILNEQLTLNNETI